MAERLPRFDPLSVLGSDDVNTLAAALDATFGVEVGSGLAGTVVPEDAKVITKIFFMERPSNNAGYVDVEWPGEPFDGILGCFPKTYGADVLNMSLECNSVGSSGASLRLWNYSSGGWESFRDSVRFFCLVIGWRAFS